MVKGNRSEHKAPRQSTLNGHVGKLAWVASVIAGGELHAIRHKTVQSFMNNTQESLDVKTKNITLGLVLSWILGGALLLGSIIGLFSSTLPSVFVLIASLLILPPINKWIAKTLKFRISGGLKFLLFLVLIGIAIATSISTKEIMPPIEQASNIPNDTESTVSVPVKKSVSNNVNKPVVTQPTISKSYQQVFTFSGNGAKKSEPFTVYGDRFKIKYNCSGDFCQAFLYKVNSSLADIFMNVAGSANDETIEYGSGTYYIQANTMGTYTMTVEDYR